MIGSATPVFAAFEFASLPMLGWLAAAVLPWLIHRWHRRQHQTTSWAAVELLLNAMQQRARRVQMQQWLLLAVRTAILVLVALAVAEPALRQWAVGANGKAQSHKIIVVDQSFSMGCKQGETSRWQRGKAYARQWIEDGDGDAVSLIAWGATTENVLGRPTFDTSMAISALEDLKLSQSSVELPAVVQSVHAAIDRAETEMPLITNHHVVFCTDLCPPTWRVGEAQQQHLESLAQRATVTLGNMCEGASNNVAIIDLQIEPAVTLRQRETSIVAKIACFGEPASAVTRVALQIEGRQVAEQQVELNREGRASVRFAYQFVDEGAKTVQVTLPDNVDGLADDDRRWLIVDVRPQLKVACFAGVPGAVDDLARALTPDVELNAGSSPIQAEVFSVGRLSDLDLTNYGAVLLGSVAELSPREAATLTEYVRQGGGLALFLGPDTNAEALQGLQDMLPAHVAGTRPTGEFSFDALEYRHPIVSLFRGQTQAGLLGVSVLQYHRLLPSDDRTKAETVLRFDSGHPMLMTDRYDLGRVAISALPASLVARTPSGLPWSSFPVSPSFLPVVRELVTYLVGDAWQQQRNLMVGQTATIPWHTPAQTATVRQPDGVRLPLSLTSVEDREQRAFSETNQQGVYQFEADEKIVARIAVNLDPRESDLRPLDAAKLPAAVLSQKAQSASGLTSAAGDFSFVRSLLASALILLLVEIGLAWTLGRGWG